MKNIAIVTGGGTGLGYYLAEEVLKKGMEVCIIGRRESKLKEAQEKLSDKYGDNIQYIAGDISDEIFVKEVFAQLAKEEKYVQYLFNCAGTGKFGPAQENTRAMIDVAFDASLIGLILMSSTAMAYMKEEGGVIVNVMSTAALRGKPNESVYCAAKWGARGFTEAIREASKGTKIKVIGAYPGGMNTDFWSPECGATLDASKFMNPSDVADVIMHAVWDRENMYVSDITIDRK